MANTETISVPKELLNDLYGTHQKIDNILETLEVLLDKETLKGIKKSRNEIKKGECIRANIEEIEKILE